MMHLILVIAVVFVFAASCLMTFALCRAATRRELPGVQPPRIARGATPRAQALGSHFLGALQAGKGAALFP